MIVMMMVMMMDERQKEQIRLIQTYTKLYKDL